VNNEPKRPRRKGLLFLILVPIHMIVAYLMVISYASHAMAIEAGLAEPTKTGTYLQYVRSVFFLPLLIYIDKATLPDWLGILLWPINSAMWVGAGFLVAMFISKARSQRR
jgi:hypothetical protein